MAGLGYKPTLWLTESPVSGMTVPSALPKMKVGVVLQTMVVLLKEREVQRQQMLTTSLYRVGIDSASQPKKQAAVQIFLFLRSCHTDI